MAMPVRREGAQVVVATDRGEERFDRAILAAHPGLLDVDEAFQDQADGATALPPALRAST